MRKGKRHSNRESRIKPVDYAKHLILIGLISYVYYPTFLWMIDRWSARDSYYGHGFLIPLVVLFWLYKRRESFLSTSGDIKLLGISLLSLGVVLQIFSSIMRIYFLSAFSFMFLLLGVVEFLFGRQTLKKVWFPILFLSAMIPLPLLLISQVTLHMKFMVSEIATVFMNGIGIHAVREGSYIYTPNSILLVGDPCSGLRSFLAFLCLGLVFAYESQMDFWKKIILVCSGLPLALASNILRVLFLGLVGEIYGMKYTAGFLHDTSGFAVFILAFFVFLAIRRRLELLRV